MKIVITGASGLIGSALVPALRADGHDGAAAGPPATGRRRRAALGPAHRARSTRPRCPASTRWSTSPASASATGAGPPRASGAVLASRVDATETVAAAVAAVDPRPRALLSALRHRLLRRHRRHARSTSPPRPGTTSSPSCAAAGRRRRAPAAEAGVRVVHLRTGLVSAGRAACSAGCCRWPGSASAARSARAGSTWSWISLADEVGAIRHLLGARRDRRAGEPHRPGAGDQRRVHHDPRAGAAPAGRAPAGAAGSRCGWRSASSPTSASSPGSGCCRGCCRRPATGSGTRRWSRRCAGRPAAHRRRSVA